MSSHAQREEGLERSDRRVFVDISSGLVADSLSNRPWLLDPHQIVDITGLPGKVVTAASLLQVLLIGIRSGCSLSVTPQSPL